MNNNINIILNEYYNLRMDWNKDKTIIHLSNKYKIKFNKLKKIVEENETKI